jgi:hypothetical protein
VKQISKKLTAFELWPYSSHLVSLNYFHVTEQNKLSRKWYNFETHFGCSTVDINEKLFIDIKSSIFQDITPCILLKFNQCFGGTCCFLNFSCCIFHVGFFSANSSTLKMDATPSSETSVCFQRTTWRYIQEHRTLHNYRCENLESHIYIVCVFRYGMTWQVCVIFEGKKFEDDDTHTANIFALQSQSTFVNCENMYRPTGVGLSTASRARASI